MSERAYNSSSLLDMHGGHVLVDNSRFAVMMALAIDAILFAGLLGAYVVLRSGAVHWPPVELSHFKLSFAIASAASLWLASIALVLAIRAQSANRLQQMRVMLILSILILGAFLVLNGSDWVTVIQSERMTHTLFGGIYFMVTGIFHLHVIAGMVYTVKKLRQVLRWRHYTRSTLSIQHLMYFYSLLTGIWMAIFFVVYP
jgi:cytochrome c oxidase subunit 3